jgi:hypothetical protein
MTPRGTTLYHAAVAVPVGLPQPKRPQPKRPQPKRAKFKEIIMSSLGILGGSLLLAVAATVSIAAQPADFTGTWTGVVNLPNGQKVPFIAHLKLQGEAVSGVLDGINGGADVTIQEGKLSGASVTFNGVRAINGMNVTFTYTATPTADGGLDFKIVRADGNAAPLESLTTRLSAVP